MLRGLATPSGSSCASRAGTEMDTIWVPVAYTLAVLGVTTLAIDALRTAWKETGK